MALVILTQLPLGSLSDFFLFLAQFSFQKYESEKTLHMNVIDPARELPPSLDKDISPLWDGPACNRSISDSRPTSQFLA